MAKYFIQDTTLTAIADAIREKTDITSSLYPKNMPSYIRSIKTTESDTTGIPDYVVTEGKRVANNIISKRGTNSITAVIMSDMHEFGDNDHTDASIIERYRRANRNAGQGAKIVSDNIDLDFFANLGDYAWGAKTSTVTDFVQSIVNTRNYMYDVMKDNESFLTVGNHDTATYGFAQNGEYLSQSVTDGLIGTYRYVDFTNKKVRVICLNTAEVEGLTVSGESGTERMTGTQLQWFADSLDLSTKSDAANWSIIILSHHPLDWGNIIPAANCLQAYLTGGSYSVTHNGVTVSKNFAGKNSAKVICQFHGHVHGFKVDYIKHGSVGSLTPTTVKRIAIPNACFARTNEYGENTTVDSNGIEFGETESYEKVDDGTAKNTAFCLISIDLDDEVIYADCYGAGYDRVISYADEVIVTYSVTNNLSNATTNNSTTTITVGSSYSASIIANNGYELSNIKVVMGGVDVTSTAVNGNNITIAEVAGDIVITVTTTIDENPGTGTYTNLVPTAIADSSGTIYNSPYGYKDGYYLSSSSINQFSADANCVATGSILIGNNVEAIYVRGATWDATNNHVRFSAGSDVGGISYNIYANGAGSNGLYNHFFTVETLSDNYYKFTLSDDGKTYLRGKYYRFSLVGTGENLIITHDQPIPQNADGSGTVITYSVNNTLNNVSTNNNNTSVLEGASYSATLTANNGYTMTGGTVIVTMGGTDITSSAYSEGNINIENVTGDIVITASAVEEQTGSINHVTTSIDSSGAVYNGTGYQEGYRLNSSGTTTASANAVNSGFIPYNGEVIRIYGTTNGTIGNNGNYLAMYNSSFAKTLVVSMTNLQSYGATWEAKDGKYMLTIDPSVITNDATKTALASAKYIRCSMAACTGANFVVTLNEAIG